MAKQGLKEKTVKGVGWSAIDNVVQYAVQFVVSVILARLLSPDDYGLLGIVVIFTAVGNTIIGGGFFNALIRKKDVGEDDYNTVFIINFCVSLFLYGIVFLCSPLIARFFGRDELVLLTRVSSLGMIISSLAIVQRARLTRRIDFKSQTKITFISSFFSGIVGVVMAFMGFGVWALIAQDLINRALSTISLWLVNKWVPTVHFSKQSFKELFGFGWKVMMSHVIDTVWKELFQVVVGKYYSPASLGQYTRAKSFSRLFSQNLTTVIQRVTYPVLSGIQDNKVQLLSAYRRIIKTTMFISVVFLFALGAISEPLLYCLIGPKWYEASTYLPLICIAVSFYPINSVNLNMLQVQGRSDLLLGITIVKKIIALAPLFVGALVGILPMLYVNLVTAVLGYLINSHFSGRFLGYSSWMQLKDVAPSYGVACAVALSVYFLKYLPLSNWVILPMQLVLGTVVFFVVCKATRIEEYDEMKEIITPYIKMFARKKK